MNAMYSYLSNKTKSVIATPFVERMPAAGPLSVSNYQKRSADIQLNSGKGSTHGGIKGPCCEVWWDSWYKSPERQLNLWKLLLIASAVLKDLKIYLIFK